MPTDFVKSSASAQWNQPSWREQGLSLTENFGGRRAGLGPPSSRYGPRARLTASASKHRRHRRNLPHRQAAGSRTSVVPSRRPRPPADPHRPILRFIGELQMADVGGGHIVDLSQRPHGLSDAKCARLFLRRAHTHTERTKSGQSWKPAANPKSQRFRSRSNRLHNEVAFHTPKRAPRPGAAKRGGRTASPLFLCRPTLQGSCGMLQRYIAA